MTPCQKCKAELVDARAKLTVAERTADTYRQAANVAEARGRDLEAMLDESMQLWKHWTEVDITDDEDRWAAFTDKVHALVERYESARRAARGD